MKHVPNMLTISRLLLIPVYFLVFYSPLPHRMQWAFGILLIAGLTDIADGYLSRKYDVVSDWGTMVDPVADKMMILSVMMSLALSGILNWWLAVFIFARDLCMIVGGAIFTVKSAKPIPANRWGKATTVFLYVVIFCFLFQIPYAPLLTIFAIAFSFFASIQYFIKYRLDRQIS